MLGRYGVTEAYVVEPAALDGYAPQAWARTLEGLLGVTLAAAVVAAGTDRGSEVLAHLGAITGQPMAANCIAAAARRGRRPLAVSRQRWAGLLIEDATLDGDAGPAHRGHRCGAAPSRCRPGTAGDRLTRPSMSTSRT